MYNISNSSKTSKMLQAELWGFFAGNTCGWTKSCVQFEKCLESLKNVKQGLI